MPAAPWGTDGGRALFPPPDVVRSQIARALSPDRSIRNAITLLAAQGVLPESISQSAWDQARARLPEDLLPVLARRVVQETLTTHGRRWRGKLVFLVDGTTVSMPDEAALADAFGYCDGKYGKSRFPTARMLAILEGTTRQVIDYKIKKYTTSELAIFRELLPTLPKDALWIGDRFFSGAVDYVLSQRHGLDSLTRLHQRRDGVKLLNQGKRIGRDEWIVSLGISSPVQRKYPELDLPDSVTARLIRVRYKTPKGEKKTTWLVTSLLDGSAYPRDEVIALYRSRWGIETHYYYCKITLQMAVLRSKTEANIRKEVAAIVLAHNLVWRLMLDAGRVAGVELDSMSFTGAVRTVMAYSPAFCFASSWRGRESVYRSMLRQIVRDQIPKRPGRHEPRLRKREPQSFGILRVSREEARQCA